MSWSGRRFLAAIGLAGAVALGGCAYDDGYGYGGVSVGTGYYGGGYYDNWGPSYYGAGYGGYPYYGWYDGFYYPGTGYYVYDRGGHRHRWNDGQRRYWEGRRDHWRGGEGNRWRGRDNWSGWRGRDNDGRPDRPGRPGWSDRDGRPGNWANRPTRPDGAGGDRGRWRGGDRMGQPPAGQPNVSRGNRYTQPRQAPARRDWGARPAPGASVRQAPATRGDGPRGRGFSGGRSRPD